MSGLKGMSVVWICLELWLKEILEEVSGVQVDLRQSDWMGDPGV